MAARTVIGSRVVVKLPFEGATDNEPQYVWMKKPVAELLGFPISKTSELSVDVTSKKKDDGDEKVEGTTKIKRPRRPGYRQRSFTVYFSSPKTPKGNTKSFNSVSFPVTTSVLVNDVIKYFETGAGSNKGVVKLRTNLGATYPIYND